MEHRSQPLAVISSQPDHPTPSQQQLRGPAALESSNRRDSNAQIRDRASVPAADLPAPHHRRPRQRWADATPIEQFKAIHCLLYQCHEGKVHESRLYDELNSAAGELAQRVVQDLPEYDKASWGD